MTALARPLDEAPQRSLPVTLRRALVLNADFRPLSTFPPSIIMAQEAVSALWRERADVVEEWPGEFFRSPSTKIAVPKVIALRTYAQVNGEPRFSRRNIFLRDRYTCQYCGKKFPSSELTYDHVVPRANKGTTTWTNIVTACIACNAAKASSLPNYSGRKAAGMFRPLRSPRRPTNAELNRAGLDFLPRDVVECWGDWLYWNSELRP